MELLPQPHPVAVAVVEAVRVQVGGVNSDVCVPSATAVAAVGLLEGVGVAAGGRELLSGGRAALARRPLQRRLEGALRTLEPSQPEPRECFSLLCFNPLS